MNDIIRLGLDLANNKVQQYSTDEANAVLRNAFLDLMGVSNGGKIDYKAFRRNKVQIFEILEVIIEQVINDGIQKQFDGFAEYRNLKWGDTNKFIIPDHNQIFKVAMVSDGNGNLRRQRLRDGEELIVSTDTYAIKIYEEFYRFLSGRVDWNYMVNKVAESFARDLAQRIYDAVYNSYGKFNSTYHKTVAGTSTAQQLEDELVQMAMHIEARTGESVAVYGTKMALRKFAPSQISFNMMDARNKLGYYGEIAGLELREIKQAHIHNTDNFAIDNNFVLLLPQNVDKMVKIVNEGETLIQENMNDNTDMTIEYTVIQKFGIAVVCSKVFGFLKIS